MRIIPDLVVFGDMSDRYKGTLVKEIYLLRHGDTEWTEASKHTGLTDIDLIKSGKKQAKRLGSRLKKIHFDHVLASPLRRVRETAELAGFGKKMKIDSGLLEWDYGDYEGLTSDEIHEDNPGWTIFNGDPPGGETAEQVEKRADDLIERVLRLEGRIALFSSGHFSRALGARWIEFPVSAGQNLVLSTAALSILSFEHGYPTITVWNDTSHTE